MHVYGIQSIVTDEVKDVQVVRFRFYASGLRGCFNMLSRRGEFEMAEIVDIPEAEEGQRFDIKVNLVGFDEGESSWESLANIWTAPPAVYQVRAAEVEA